MINSLQMPVTTGLTPLQLLHSLPKYEKPNNDITLSYLSSISVWFFRYL